MRLIKMGVSQQQRNLIDIISPEFIILVNTELAGSPSNTMNLPIRGTNMTIDWGDGSLIQTVTQTAAPTSANWIAHQYTVGGIYQIKIGGGLDWIRFAGTGDSLKLIEINNWGTATWTSMQESFYLCYNLNHDTSTDTANVSNVTSFYRCFNPSSVGSLLNPNVEKWSVSNGTNFQDTFAYCNNFNRDIRNWNTAKATNMVAMLRATSSFNYDLSGWCVPLISSRPIVFSLLPTEMEPIWGTCPQT